MMLSPNVYYEGFTPEDDYSKSLYSELYLLFEYVPYDSNLSMYLSRNKGLYSVTLMAESLTGSIKAFSRGRSLSLTTRNVFDKIYSQIREWRMERFDHEIMPLYEEFYMGPDLDLVEKNQAPRILVVDDEPSSVFVVESSFAKSGCQVTTAQSAVEAIEKLTSHAYDLLILDWGLPGMNGGEALMSTEMLNAQQIQTNYNWSNLKLPVIVYSGASRDKILRPECKHFRFIDHWDKDMSHEILLEKTAKVLTYLDTDVADARSQIE